MAYNKHYYRPEWTCGRFDNNKKGAIFYNLIEGMSYFFEDDSAEVIGAILDCNRNGEVSIEQVGLITQTNMESLEPFFDQLCQLNLLTTEVPTLEGILNYRKALTNRKRSNAMQMLDKPTKEKLPIEQTNAESAYANRVGGVMNVMLELTYNCSEKCIHCYNIGASRNDTEQSYRNNYAKLTIEEYTRIIDELYDNGLVKVTLSGG